MSEIEVSSDTTSTDDLDAFSLDFFGQKPSDVDATTIAPDVEQDKGAVVEATGAQTTPDEPDDVDPNAEYVEPPKKKQTFQDRLNELVKQREDVKREGDQRLEQLRQEFEQRIASLSPKPVAKTNDEPQPDDTKEDGTAKYDLGEFDPLYIRDLTRHTLETERTRMTAQAAEEQRVQTQRQAQETLTSTWNGKVTEAATEYPDFQEKVTPMLNGFNNLDTAYAGYLSTVIMQMDKGTDVLYYLSNNPQEASAIVNSGAQKATLALGRIEARFMDADAQKRAPKPKVSNAPPPVPARVQARGTNGAFVSVSPDTDDLRAFENEFFAR